jgi:hypothetical protein
MPPAPYDLAISAARADALFASPLQRSDEPSARQVQQAIATAIGVHGVRGCAARLAQAAQVVLEWRRPGSPARCSNRRWHPVLALGQLTLAVAFGLQGGGTGLAVRDPQVVSLAGRN